MITVERIRKLTLEDIPANIKPDELLQFMDTNNHLMDQLRQQDGELYDTLSSRDLSRIRLLLMTRSMNNWSAVYKRNEELQAISANPDSHENQQKIEDTIRLHVCYV